MQAHPSNWRLHPTGQRESLSHVLEQIGFVQTVLVNKRTGRMVDGHLRVELAQEQDEQELPVTYVDLSAEEEDEILAVLDPLAGLAVADPDKLQALIDRVSIPADSAIAGALEGMMQAVAVPSDDDWASAFADPAADDKDRVQLTIVLTNREMTQLREHLLRYDAKPSKAVMKWLRKTSSFSL